MLSQTRGDALCAFHQCQNRGGKPTNHCGPYALAMAANVLLDEARFDGDAVSRELNHRWVELWPYPRINRFPRDTATWPGAMARFFVQHGMRSKLHLGSNLGALKQRLDAGRIALPIFGQWTYRVKRLWQPWAHTMAVLGYDEQGLLALDSATPYAQLQRHTWKPWLTWWRSMGRIWIEAWR